MFSLEHRVELPKVMPEAGAPGGFCCAQRLSEPCGQIGNISQVVYERAGNSLGIHGVCQGLFRHVDPRIRWLRNCISA